MCNYYYNIIAIHNEDKSKYIILLTVTVTIFFMQMLNAIINGEFNAKSQQVSVPLGLKSVGWSVRLAMILRNRRAEGIHLYWVDYAGNPVLYGYIPPGGGIRQLTFGTHPWLITTTSGDLITVIIPGTANVDLTIE